MIFSNYPMQAAVLSWEFWKKTVGSYSRNQRVASPLDNRQVKDEVSARSRLNQLGLLTSASLRMDFRKVPKRISAPPPGRSSAGKPS
jgi:hypothetical protein